jgi:cytochrome bd ubiquinol oxidase subunit II
MGASSDPTPRRPFPLMLLYTLVSYRVFRGKVGETAGYGHH